MVIVNGSLASATTASSKPFYNGMITLTADTTDYLNTSAGEITFNAVNVISPSKAIALPTGLTITQLANATMIYKCAYPSANKSWTVSQCSSTTNIVSSEALCCSYFTTKFIQSSSLATIVEEEEFLISIIEIALALCATIIITAIGYIVFSIKKGNSYVEHAIMTQRDETTTTIDDATARSDLNTKNVFDYSKMSEDAMTV
jgi:hypothetical protein